MTNGEKTTFWKFLSEYSIAIPIIQRDYAQGRKGKEELRKCFLKDLKEAIENNTPLTMDFTYGSFENKVFYPLDGQQRLTTLWLVHWYIAYMAGQLTQAKTTLQKFSYATRVSARDFCRKLCELTSLPPDKNNLVEHIRNQNWFYSVWNQDPTIQSMLRMLAGTGQDDGIVDVMTFNDYSNKWSSICGNCPIDFRVLDITEIGQTDDLYVKMNARGKALTSFENFKAELVNYIHKHASNAEQDKKQDWNRLNDPKNGFAQKLDNAWTDIFWKLRSGDDSGKDEYQNHIDEIFFAFFNRYFFNLQASTATEDNWRHLTLYTDDLRFHGMEPYGELSLECFLEFEKILDRFPALGNMDVSPSWEQESFEFLPKYAKDNNGKLILPDDGNMSENLAITSITVKQRAVFFAVCKWLDNNKPTDNQYSAEQIQHFQDWMRVIWNIVENSDTDSNLPGALHLINELAKHCDDILTFLASEEGITSNFAKEQMQEERQKACLFVKDANWKDVICKAEALPFLKGRLAVLLNASEQNIESFEKIVEECSSKISSGEKEKMAPAFQDYLSFAQNCDLPLAFNKNFFNCATWKSMFFTDIRKEGVINWFKAFIGKYTSQNPTTWADNLRKHWDDICDNPDEYLKIAVYTHGWDNNKIFLYRTSDIRRAQLLSPSHRPRLLEDLEPTPSSLWKYNDYNIWIKLKNGMTLSHSPDDVISLQQNDKPINKLKEYDLPLTLSDGNYDKVLDAIREIACSNC